MQSTSTLSPRFAATSPAENRCERPEDFNPSVGTTLVWPGGAERWRVGAELTDGQWALVEDFAARFGSQYDSYLAVGARNRLFFFAEGRKGIVSGVLRGKRLGIFGGILGPRSGWNEVVTELMRDCRLKNIEVSFFAVDNTLRLLLEAHGFGANKFGQGAIVDLAANDWTGKKFEWVRRQTSFCRRHALTVEEISPSDLSAPAWSVLRDEVLQIENNFLSDRSQGGGLRHVVGAFQGQLEGRQRLFTAKNHLTGNVEAFIVCNPCLNGSRWVLECFRRRPDATRGVIGFLMHQTMCTLKNEGVTQADLCMVPFVNCETPSATENRLVRKLICFAADHLNWVYDARGLLHFKSRFRPDFEDLYVCASSGVGVGWLYYSIVECRFLDISPANTIRRLVKHIFGRRDRSGLSGLI